MEVHLIVAVANANNAIGKDNGLLWHLPKDMQFFRRTTVGFPIITGRKNFESIPKKFRPLPERKNIVVTRQSDYSYEGAVITHSLEDAIEKAKEDNPEKCFIIGGGQIYQEALDKDLVDQMHITWVKGDFDADTFFPKLDLKNKWQLYREEGYLANEKNPYDMVFGMYRRK